MRNFIRGMIFSFVKPKFLIFLIFAFHFYKIERKQEYAPVWGSAYVSDEKNTAIILHAV